MRKLLAAEVSGYLAMGLFILLMLLGGARPALVLVGAGGSVGFAIVVQILWNARVAREARFHDRVRGPEFGSGTAPLRGAVTCTVFVCGNPLCVNCRHHDCTECGRAMYEHADSWTRDAS